MKNIIVNTLCLFLLCSCTFNKHEKQQNIVEFWSGKTIMQPKRTSTLINTLYNQDSIDQKCNTKIEILAYLNAECEMCIPDFLKWEEFLYAFPYSENVCVKVFVFSYSMEQLGEMFEKESIEISHPGFLLDSLNVFATKNNLPEEKIYNAFLVVDGKVDLIGNPIMSKPIEDLFLKRIDEILKK